jgi:hypothetical protein
MRDRISVALQPSKERPASQDRTRDRVGTGGRRRTTPRARGGASLAAAAVLAAAIVAPAALCADGFEPGSTTQRLFRIERSKNANIVAYDVRLDRDGNPDPREPVEAYWVLAADGARSALSAVQKRFAYGFKSRFVTPEVVVLQMAADIGREITVERVGGAFRAIVDIAGHRAALDRIYVKSIERKLLLPSVEFVDLFGVDLDAGAERHERILP